MEGIEISNFSNYSTCFIVLVKNQTIAEMEKALSQFGAISGSTTFPGHCVVELSNTASIFTETRLTLVTFDVNGKKRKSGGDPVKVDIVKKIDDDDTTVTGTNCDCTIGASIKDNENGTYTICFRYL